jgi:hypothetical protein
LTDKLSNLQRAKAIALAFFLYKCIRCLFIICYPSCTARVLFQSHQRFRYLIDNQISFTLPKKTSYNYIYGLCSYYLSFYFNFDDEIKNNYDIQYKLLQKIKDKINNCNGYCELYKGQNLKKVEEYEIFLKNLKELPEDLKKIKQYNLLEYIINGLYYNYSFYYFLNKCNYKINKDFFIDFEQLDKDIKEMNDMAVQIRSSKMDADQKRDTLIAIGRAQNGLTANIKDIKKLID